MVCVFIILLYKVFFRNKRPIKCSCQIPYIMKLWANFPLTASLLLSSLSLHSVLIEKTVSYSFSYRTEREVTSHLRISHYKLLVLGKHWSLYCKVGYFSSCSAQSRWTFTQILTWIMRSKYFSFIFCVFCTLSILVYFKILSITHILWGCWFFFSFPIACNKLEAPGEHFHVFLVYCFDSIVLLTLLCK